MKLSVARIESKTVARVALCLAVVSCWAPGRAAAQRPGHSLGVVITQSLSSRTSAAPPPCCVPAEDLLAPLTLTTVEVELTIPLRSRSDWGFEYPLRAVPLALARHNPTDSAMRLAGGWSMSPGTPRERNLGAGVKPLALRAWVGGGRVRLEGDVSAGFLLFANPMLAANASRFNFVAEADVGVRFALPDGREIVVGYRRHHLSNGGLAEVNPGLNSHVLYVGLWLDSL